MVKSFIKFKPVTGHSESHNQREILPKYLISAERENIHIADERITERRAKIEKIYFENVGQKMQKKATPIREAVILLPDDNNEINLKCLFSLSDQLKEKYGLRCFQWHIHNDEGHIDEQGKPRYNYHAHMVFDWTDATTGKSLKLNKEDMSDIQTLTAEIMGMERGQKGSKNLSLNHHQYRGYLQVKDKLKKELKTELTQEQDRKIREQIKLQDNENTRRNRTGIKR